MRLKFSPQVREDTHLVLSVVGETLIINGVSFDLSVIPEGATLPAHAVGHELVIGDVDRVNGELSLTLLLPIPADACNILRFPEDVEANNITVIDTEAGIYPWPLGE
jgi:hypothetical protein